MDSLRASVDTMSDTAQQQAAEIAKNVAAKSRRDLADRLNHAVRGLIHADSVALWKELFLDSVQSYCARAALFHATEEKFILEAVRGLANQLIHVQRGDAPALVHAIELGETTVAARVASEVSPAIAALFGESAKVYLFPIVSDGKTSGVLLAGEVSEQSAIELLAGVAGLALKKIRENSETALARIAAQSATNPGVGTSVPLWEKFPAEVRDRHARAKRFARVAVAEMQLHFAPAIASGRKTANLYSSLRPQIDAARQRYKEEFTPGEKTMVDYLHVELAAVLAKNDTELLGADYPGPLA